MVKLVKAKVFHKRCHPKNVFCYKAGYIALPLINFQNSQCVFSVDKFNLFSFHNKDYAQKDGSPAIEWLYKNLHSIGMKKSDFSEIVLITHPRCLGFAFNPVSFYFCLNAENQPIAIVAEVNNTFSQTHSYIICEENLTPIVQNKKYKAEKEFFVSPFFKREGYYEFKFSYLKDGIAIFINYFKNGDLLFETSLIGKFAPLKLANALPYVFTTFKTVILIGFQALILKFFKKLKFRRPPAQLRNKITFNKL